jgi:hypothetical protein
MINDNIDRKNKDEGDQDDEELEPDEELGDDAGQHGAGSIFSRKNKIKIL